MWHSVCLHDICSFRWVVTNNELSFACLSFFWPNCTAWQQRAHCSLWKISITSICGIENRQHHIPMLPWMLIIDCYCIFHNIEGRVQLLTFSIRFYEKDGAWIAFARFLTNTANFCHIFTPKLLCFGFTTKKSCWVDSKIHSAHSQKMFIRSVAFFIESGNDELPNFCKYFKRYWINSHCG